MSLIHKLIYRNGHFDLIRLLLIDIQCKRYLHSTSLLNSKDEEEFRVLNLKPVKKKREERKLFKPPLLAPRANSMSPNQDWPSVWPGPKTFHPASVPLPVRQGYNPKGPPPDKYGNTELMKIPNFLHLTPPAIKRHCEALKKFCTPWPEGLEDDEKCQKHFPIEVISTDYCHSAPTIRNPLARIVTIKVKLSSLNLNERAKDKLLRIVGERYNPEDDILTIVADRCPLRKQNFDYAMYLLTVIYHESWKTEPWESEKSLEDMEYYDWNRNVSKKNFETLVDWLKNKSNVPEEFLPDPKEYKEAVEDLINKGEDEYTLNKYKESTLKLLSLSSDKNI